MSVQQEEEEEEEDQHTPTITPFSYHTQNSGSV